MNVKALHMFSTLRITNFPILINSGLCHSTAGSSPPPESFLLCPLCHSTAGSSPPPESYLLCLLCHSTAGSSPPPFLLCLLCHSTAGSSPPSYSVLCCRCPSPGLPSYHTTKIVLSFQLRLIPGKSSPSHRERKGGG